MGCRAIGMQHVCRLLVVRGYRAIGVQGYGVQDGCTFIGVRIYGYACL